MGEKVEQFHVEANGSYSEEFALGQSDFASKMDNQTDNIIEEEEEDPIEKLILYGEQGKKVPYMVIDKESGGYVVRVFN